MAAADSNRKYLGEDKRTQQTRDAPQAAERTLQLALFGRADLARHRGLCRRSGEAPQGEEGGAGQKERAGGSEGIGYEAQYTKQ